VAEGTPADPGCPRCGKPLASEWTCCPFCGRPRSGSASNERVLRIVGKIGGLVTEAGLMHLEREAERNQDAHRVEQIQLVRRTVREVTPLVIDVLAEYLAQSRQRGAANGGTSGPSAAPR
jgi:hypothetical protein